MSALRPRIQTIKSRESVIIPQDELIADGELILYPGIADNTYFTVQFLRRQLQLTAKQYIGLIPVNAHLTINVEPKLPVKNLGRVIALAQHPDVSLDKYFQLYSTTLGAPVNVVEFLARNLLTALRTVETNGFHRIYVPRTDNTAHPRGRIDVQLTAQRNIARGLRHEAYSTRFEQTIDEPYNQLLKHALWVLVQRLRRLRSSNRELIQQLNKALIRFDSVSLVPTSELVARVEDDLQRNRIPVGRQYYTRALRIAITAIAGRGLLLHDQGAEVSLSSYIIDFEKVFEAYLRNVLAAWLPNLHPGTRVRDGNKQGVKRGLYNEKRDPPAQPDVVIDAPGIAESLQTYKLIVGDVKYKDTVDRQNVEQVVTFGCVYRTTTVVLIHQRKVGRPGGRGYLGTIGEIAVHTYAFDLDAVDLEAEEHIFATAMAAIFKDTKSD